MYLLHSWRRLEAGTSITKGYERSLSAQGWERMTKGHTPGLEAFQGFLLITCFWEQGLLFHDKTPFRVSPKLCYGSEKVMAPHSSTLAWKIPWTEEPGRLQSMELRRVRHDWATSLSLFTFMHWRRKWQPTPVFLPGESQGWGILVGCRLWGHTESDTTEVT